MELLLILLGICLHLGITTTVLTIGFTLGLAYGCWSYCERDELQGGKPWQSMRRWRIWRWTLGLWCPVTVIYDDGDGEEKGVRKREEESARRREVDARLRRDTLSGDALGCGVPDTSHTFGRPPPKGTLWAHHPHGVWPTTMPLTWGLVTRGEAANSVVAGGKHAGSAMSRLLRSPVTNIVKGHRLAVTRILFWIPFVCDVAKWLGCIDAGRASIANALGKGLHVHLTPGGVKEVLTSDHRTLELCLQHTGFLRLAWNEGVHIHPVFDADETAVYRTWKWPSALRGWTTRVFGWPVPTLFAGPLPGRLRSCVGAALVPRHYKSLEEFSAAYWAELFRLVRKYKRPEQALGPGLAAAMAEAH